MQQDEQQLMASTRSLLLADFPPDALNHILDHLETSSSWLETLLVVSKQFYALVLPRLYRVLDISINSSDDGPAFDYRTLQMLDKANQGLEHVRTLTLRHYVHLPASTSVKGYPEAALLIHLLPKNILMRFNWGSWNPMPHQINQTLYSRQKSLKEIELNCSDISIDEMFGSSASPLSSLHWLKDLEALRIMPHMNEAMPEVACELFKQHETIQYLKLDLVHMHPDTDGGNIKESLTSSGGIHALFGNLVPSSTHLRNLRLKGINFIGCHKELISALDLSSLLGLTIANCQNAEKFLAALAKSPGIQSMQLTGLTFHHSKEWQPSNPDNLLGTEPEIDPLLTAIDLFLLNTPASLKDLWICLRGFDRLPRVNGLIHHSSTLQWLFVDVRERKGPGSIHAYTLEDWQLLCSSLGSIQQLDMAYPEVVADSQIILYPEFCAYVKATASMGTLRNLGVSNWPYVYSRTGWKGLNLKRDACKPALSALATDIMNLRGEQATDAKSRTSSALKHVGPKHDSPSTKLQVITFGIWEDVTRKSNWGFGLTPPLDFLRSRVITVGGQQTWTMQSVNRNCLDSYLLGQEYDIDELAHGIGEFESGVDEVQW